MQKMKILLLALIIPLAFVSCDNDDDAEGETRFKAHLTDGPAAYGAVNIDVQALEVFYADGSSTVITAINPGVYNLLIFNNGMDTLITSSMIPSGDIEQIRLVLGSNNSVEVNGVQHPLQTPSAQQSGLKINVDATLQANTEYHLWIDFDAYQSIVLQGNGDYLLKPVIRAFTKEKTGGIDGSTMPVHAVSRIYVVTSSSDTVSTIPNSSGYFKLDGLSSDSYDVTFNTMNMYQDTTIMNVTVNAGSTTNIGTINF